MVFCYFDVPIFFDIQHMLYAVPHAKLFVDHDIRVDSVGVAEEELSDNRLGGDYHLAGGWLQQVDACGVGAETFGHLPLRDTVDVTPTLSCVYEPKGREHVGQLSSVDLELLPPAFGAINDRAVDRQVTVVLGSVIPFGVSFADVVGATIEANDCPNPVMVEVRQEVYSAEYSVSIVRHSSTPQA